MTVAFSSASNALRRSRRQSLLSGAVCGEPLFGPNSVRWIGTEAPLTSDFCGKHWCRDSAGPHFDFLLPRRRPPNPSRRAGFNPLATICVFCAMSVPMRNVSSWSNLSRQHHCQPLTSGEVLHSVGTRVCRVWSRPGREASIRQVVTALTRHALCAWVTCGTLRCSATLTMPAATAPGTKPQLWRRP